MKHNFIPYNQPNFKQENVFERVKDYYELMSTRRSVREYSNKPIAQDVIDMIIKTAGSAPSGANKQPWKFCVIKNQELKSKIREAVEEEEKKNYDERFPQDWLDDLEPLGTTFSKPHIEDAPVIIVVFKENYKVINGKKEKNYYVNESVGIATGLLISAIHNAGLVTLTHTPNPMKFLNEILDRPTNEVPVLIMPIGYPADDATVPDIGRKSLDEIMILFE